MPQADEPRRPFLTLSRRAFLGSVAAASGVYLAGCAPDDLVPPDRGDQYHSHGPMPGDVLQFLTEEEAAIVDAVIARLIPGDVTDPGAREAGVLYYIDAKLATNERFAEPTYFEPPFAHAQDEATADDDLILVAEDQLYRYGFQSDTLPRDLYRRGLAGIDQLARELYGAGFAEAPEAGQDEILTLLDDIAQSAEPSGRPQSGGSGGSTGSGEGESQPGFAEREAVAEQAFGDIDPGSFFSRVRTDTIEGMFADPSYGGNRDFAGWALIGYPGAVRAWSPQDMLTVGVRRKPQSLEDLTPMNPDLRDSPAREALEQPRRGVVDG